MVQEAALVAMNRLDSFTPGTSFGAWMSQIVRNIARNAARKDHRRQTTGVDSSVLDQMRPGTLGGPIVRDRAHFFFGVERILFDQVYTTEIPSRPDLSRSDVQIATSAGMSFKNSRSASSRSAYLVSAREEQDSSRQITEKE